MKPIQLNKQQIEAILNGATMLCMLISKECHTCQGRIEDNNDTDIWEECRNPNSKYYYESILNVENNTCENWVLKENITSPLQIGEEYYVQEEIDCIGDCNIGLPCQTCGSSQGIGKALADTNIRIKPTDIQVKRVQDLTISEMRTMLCMSFDEVDADWDNFEPKFKQWHNKQYPNQPYEDNPYVFLPKLERI